MAADIILNGGLVLMAIGVILWGFKQYRTQFIKAHLLISIGIAGGLLAIVFAPIVFDYVGALLNLQRRLITILFLSNITLLLGMLYFASMARKNRGHIREINRSHSIDRAPTPVADGGSKTVAVIIPAYNEEATIGNVVKSLPDSIRGYAVEPIVVSDGSADATAEQAKLKGVTVIEHSVNQGQGGALKTGFEVAFTSGAAVVVTMDADGQHPAEDLERFVEPIIEDRADYVTGSRHAGSDYSQNSTVRRAGIRFFTWLINILTRASVTDCTNGYRAIRGTDLEGLTLTEERFSAPELIIEARKNGLRIEEIPITVAKRESGETTKPQFMYAIGLARTILVTWLR